MKDCYDEVLKSVPKMHKLVKALIRQYNSALTLDKRRGGAYISVFDAETGELIVCFPIGSFSVEKGAKYLDFSLGKGRQLFRHLSEGHTSSAQSASEGYPQGAIYVPGEKYIFSTSGQEPQDDENISLALNNGFPDFKKTETGHFKEAKHMF